MKLPHDGIDVSLLCAAIDALEKVCGPKLLSSDTGNRVLILLAELQHEYKKLPDPPAKKPARKAKK